MRVYKKHIDLTIELKLGNKYFIITLQYGIFERRTSNWSFNILTNNWFTRFFFKNINLSTSNNDITFFQEIIEIKGEQKICISFWWSYREVIRLDKYCKCFRNFMDKCSLGLREVLQNFFPESDVAIGKSLPKLGYWFSLNLLELFA